MFITKNTLNHWFMHEKGHKAVQTADMKKCQITMQDTVTFLGDLSGRHWVRGLLVPLGSNVSGCYTDVCTCQHLVGNIS